MLGAAAAAVVVVVVEVLDPPVAEEGYIPLGSAEEEGG